MTAGWVAMRNSENRNEKRPEMQLGVRLSELQHAKLEALARRDGTSKSDVVRALVDAASVDTEIPAVPRLTEDEMLDILHAQARAGRTGALLALLKREQDRDPRARTLELFRAMVEERQQ
jgi:hypothetical protein